MINILKIILLGAGVAIMMSACGGGGGGTPPVVTTVPGAPTIGTVTAGNAQAVITFTAPASNGGSAITSYTATSVPGGFTGTGTGSPITITGLANGTAYTFTVTATNGVGTGPASAASNSVIPALPTTAQLTLSIQSEPSLLGTVEVDIQLPGGVKPASLVDEGVFDKLNATGSTTILGTAFFLQTSTFTVSTNTLKVFMLPLDLFNVHGLGLGSYSRINCVITAGTPITAASFPSTATVLSASDTSLVDITNVSTIAVPIGVVLQ